MKGFEKRGLAPKWDQSLTILDADPKSTAAIEGRPIRPVAYPQNLSDGTYELTLITYTNNTSQWEGVVYFHNPYEDDTYSALATTPETTDWDTVYEYWYPPDGGDPTCGGGACEVQGRLMPGIKNSPKASFMNASHTLGPLAKPGFFGRIRSWVSCIGRWVRGVGYYCEDLLCAVTTGWTAIKTC